MGHCCFHQENTPSFTVFGDKRFYCFGCKKGGDSIDFVREILGLSLPDSLKRIAADFGIAGEAQSYTPAKPKILVERVLRFQYFGTIDLLRLDREELRVRLLAYKDLDEIPRHLVHDLGTVDCLIEELSTGSPEEKAAALVKGRAWLNGRHWQRTIQIY